MLITKGNFLRWLIFAISFYQNEKKSNQMLKHETQIRFAYYFFRPF